MWTYRCYNDGKTPNLWARWYAANPQCHGSHDAIFEMLEQRTNWGKPHADFLDKNERIVEVRLTGKVKHRILGFYGENRQEFVVLATCNHKGKVYDPPDIRATVIKRKNEIKNGERNAIRCTRPI